MVVGLQNIASFILCVVVFPEPDSCMRVPTTRDWIPAVDAHLYSGVLHAPPWEFTKIELSCYCPVPPIVYHLVSCLSWRFLVVEWTYSPDINSVGNSWFFLDSDSPISMSLCHGVWS